MGAIPLPLLPPSSSPHFLRRLFRRPISLISAATPPHILTSTTSLRPFSPHFLTTFSLPHSLSASQQLAGTLSDAVLEADNSKHGAENKDKVVDSDEINRYEANLLAVNPLNDVVLEDETDNYEYVAEDEVKVDVLAVNALNDVVLEDESDNSAENNVVLDDETETFEAEVEAENALNGVVLEDETYNYEYVAEDEDKVVDSDSKTNVLAVNALNDVVLDDETDTSEAEAENAVNGVVLEEEIGNYEYEAEDEDNVVNSDKTLNGVVLEDETDTSEDEDEDNVVDLVCINALDDVVLEEEVENCDNSKTNVFVVDVKPQPVISIKEKKELASYAHSLGKKLKSQQVGKSGVTVTVITALIETLEKNELLKLKIHGNCPSEMDDAVKLVEMGTGSVAVSQIGRTVILYRPSISKLQAEQKKKEARRKLMKKRPAWVRSSSQSQEELPKLTSRGRRGSSRV